MTENSFSLLYAIAQLIYDKKGMNIMALDVHGISSITDFLLIAEGTVDRHVAAMGHAIIKELREKNIHPPYVEGLKSGDWVVLDYGEIMVHLFTPGLREKYCLERLWTNSKIVELPIDISSNTIIRNNLHSG